jgi:hypothetical protein
MSRCTGCPTLIAHRNDDYCRLVNEFWHDGFHQLCRASLVAHKWLLVSVFGKREEARQKARKFEVNFSW